MSAYPSSLKTEKTAVHLQAGQVLAGGDSPAAFQARFVRAGRARAAGNNPSPLVIGEAALQQALDEGLFNALPVFIDHAAPHQPPSLRNLAAISEAAHWNPASRAVEGKLRFYDTPDARAIAALLLQILGDDQPPDVGLSLVFWADFSATAQPGADLIVERIRHVESIDLVFEPAAGGRILQALSALSTPTHEQRRTPMTIQDLYVELNQNTALPEPGTGDSRAAENHMTAWLQAAAQAPTKMLVQAAHLPAASKERLLSQRFATPLEVQEAIEGEKAYLAALVEQSVVSQHSQAPRGAHIQMGRSGYEQFQLAFEAMLDGVRPPEGIRPLSGLREFYNLVSGDYELTGQFHGERVYLANVNSSSMAGLVANALNKRVVNQFNQYPRWWEPVAIQEDFANLQQVKWITLAGIGSLPTVSEGAAYTELNWDDKTESADFIKKGGYLGITLEAIDKDDTRRLRAAPQALALGAYLTLSRAVAQLFSANSGSGAFMSDSNPLFCAAHANLGTSALSLSAWAATRQGMRDQSDFAADGGSTAALGTLTTPRFLLVPNELEQTALEILGGYSGSSAGFLDTNIWSEGDTHTQRMRSARARVVVVDLWTAAHDWVAVCDPLLYPTIGIGYRYGRAPEIFSVANPNSGLMFTNDVMPVKVRFFFAVGAMDWRGMYKHIVA